MSGIYWPATLLSCDIPNSRILSFGYDADVLNFWTPTSQNRIGNHASTMLGGLTHLREESDTVGLWPCGFILIKGIDFVI